MKGHVVEETGISNRYLISHIYITGSPPFVIPNKEGQPRTPLVLCYNRELPRVILCELGSSVYKFPGSFIGVFQIEDMFKENTYLKTLADKHPTFYIELERLLIEYYDLISSGKFGYMTVYVKPMLEKYFSELVELFQSIGLIIEVDMMYVGYTHTVHDCFIDFLG